MSTVASSRCGFGIQDNLRRDLQVRVIGGRACFLKRHRQIHMLAQRFRFVSLALTLLFTVWISDIYAQTPGTCATALAKAETQYVQGQLDETITLLAPCLGREAVAAAEAVSAYRLLALSYIKKGNLEEAKIAVLELLNRSPSYEPDPIRDLPSYAALVNVVKQQLVLAAGRMPVEGPEEKQPAEPIQPVKHSWLRAHRGWLIGSSVALVGIVSAIAAGGGGGAGGDSGGGLPEPIPTLPRPPGLPN